MSISAYVVWFLLASLTGWIFESLYSIVRTGHWERRGFLFGPLCPIYGVGVVAGLLLFDRPEIASGEIPAWVIFLVSMCVSAVLEYTVSVAMEHLFGTVWWDYSDLPLNLNGRICLPASLLFGIAGIAVAYLVVPALNIAYAVVPHAVYEVAALVATALLACDFTITVLSLSDLMDKIEELDTTVNARADELVRQTAGTLQAIPAQLQDSGGRAYARVRDGVAERSGKAREAITTRAERVSSIAARLTERQIWLLGQLRRFRTASLREGAAQLRGALRRRDGDDQ